jgi:hypothetical protein
MEFRSISSSQIYYLEGHESTEGLKRQTKVRLATKPGKKIVLPI